MKFISWFVLLAVFVRSTAQVNVKISVDTSVATPSHRIEEVVISGTLQERSKSDSPIAVESYSAKFFQKNASINLFESMNMINGVQPQLNCSVCNTGDIHINGMEGPYTMILIDGMPIVSSLATVYGLMGIPNSMIKRVEVVKGPASTLYGSEAVAGLINVITKSGIEGDRFKLDFNASSLGEFNTDIAAAFRLKKASTLLGINYFNYLVPRDVNGDNFTDVTLQNRVSIFNKWNIERKNSRVFSIAARYVWEDRWGGQMQWQKKFAGSDSVYGETILTHRAELFGAYQLPTGNENLFLDYSYNYHFQNSFYGTVHYKAKQHVGFVQLRYVKQTGIQHITVGVPLRVTHYDDNTIATSQSDSIFTKNKPQLTILPGIFVQDELVITNRFTALFGIRYDYNSLHGNIFTPRLAFKITPVPNHVLRLNIGNGYRVVNLFTEDHAALTGARKMVIAQKLKPEQSWNASLNYNTQIQHKFGYVNIDGSVFFTYFTNRIVPDYISNPTEIRYNNLNGYGISNGAAANVEANFTNGLKMLVGLTYANNYQVNRNDNGEKTKTQVLHAPRFSATFSAGYSIRKLGLSFDLTGRINGPMYLPVVPNDFRSDISPWYCILNLQVTKTFKQQIELYAGAKNILNFIPAHPILRPHDPFNKAIDVDNPNNYRFDTSYNYASVQGAKALVGIRYTLK